MNKVTLAVAVLLVAILAGSAVAGYMIYSTTTTAQVGFTLSLTNSVSGSEVTLTATLINKTSSLPISSATIHFFNCTDSIGSNPVELGTNLTDASGIAIYLYVADHDAIYYFKAGYLVP